MKKLREEGVQIGRYRVRKRMSKLGLAVTQRVAYKATTVRKHSAAVADNLLNRCVNPVAPNEVWAGDVTYLKTGEGWVYLAIVMDFYSRPIVGWHIDKRMTKDLVCKALIKAYNLRQPSYRMRASMGDVGACYDNAVVERFFGSLKPDWLFKIHQPTRELMKQDVAAYMRYDNLERRDSSNGDMSPINYESSLRKVSGST